MQILRTSAVVVDDPDWVLTQAIPAAALRATIPRVPAGYGDIGAVSIWYIWVDGAGTPVNENPIAGTMDLTLIRVAPLPLQPDQPVGAERVGNGATAIGVNRDSVQTFGGMRSGEFTIRCSNIVPAAGAAGFRIYWQAE